MYYNISVIAYTRKMLQSWTGVNAEAGTGMARRK
jgi:hypothetical protein